MLLWIIFAGLTTLALAAVLWPYLFPRTSDRQDVQAVFDSAVYRDQLDELEADVVRGLISESEAEAAKVEISRRLIAAADNPETKTNAKRGRRSKTSKTSSKATKPAMGVMAAAACIPLFAVGLYLLYGSPGLPDQPLEKRLAEAQSNPKIDVLIRKVEERLRTHPEDGQGWDVIAPVYLKTKRYNDAANAYSKAIRLLGETRGRLVGLGEALVLANNGIVTEPARRAFTRALAGDGFVPKAQFWLGIAAEQDGDFAMAAKVWREMLSRGSKEASWRNIVQDRLTFANTRLGQSSETPVAGAGEVRGPSREDIAAAKEMTPEARTEMINQMVDGLAARLKEDGSDLEGWLRLVRAYTVLGKREEAGEALKSARGNFAKDEQALAALDKLREELGL